MLNFREELNKVTKQKKDEKEYTRYAEIILKEVIDYLKKLYYDTYLAIDEIKFCIEDEKFLVRFSTQDCKDTKLFEVFLHQYSSAEEKIEVLEGLKKKIRDEGFEFFQTHKTLTIKLEPIT